MSTENSLRQKKKYVLVWFCPKIPAFYVADDDFRCLKQTKNHRIPLARQTNPRKDSRHSAAAGGPCFVSAVHLLAWRCWTFIRGANQVVCGTENVSSRRMLRGCHDEKSGCVLNLHMTAGRARWGVFFSSLGSNQCRRQPLPTNLYSQVSFQNMDRLPTQKLDRSL